MSKQMRMIVAGASLLAIALLVWALLLRPPAPEPAPTTPDEVSTFAKPGARGSSSAAPGRSGRADNGSRSRRGGSTPDDASTAVVDPPVTAGAAAPAIPAARGASPAPSAPIEFVTVGPTYNATDPGVTPPVLLSPLVPRSLSQARPNAPAGDVRILINPDGTVESVRATVDPKTMGEAIIITNALSMAKTWRFQPATKDGKPVRYSLMVPLSRF